jgi:hypothetical protein
MWEGLATKKNHTVKRPLQESSGALSTSAPRTPGSQKEHPKGKKKVMETPTDLYELTF